MLSPILIWEPPHENLASLLGGRDPLNYPPGELGMYVLKRQPSVCRSVGRHSGFFLTGWLGVDLFNSVSSTQDENENNYYLTKTELNYSNKIAGVYQRT